MYHTIRFCLILLSFVFAKESFAQNLCTGALGDPIPGAGTNFGSGQNKFGSPLSNTTYRYVSGNPQDGAYTLAKTMSELNSGWLKDVKNHTPNDPEGYMMVVNASFTKDIFYTATVSNLCAGTTYEFGAYIINLLSYSGIKPNVTFAVYDENHILLAPKYSTGDIPEGSSNDWKKYALTFTTPPGSGAVTIELSNENPGGIGNDLALDDITFRACGPAISTSINNSLSSSPINICAGQSEPLLFTAEISTGYSDPVFQWQKNNGTGFEDLPGETFKSFYTRSAALPIGNYQYRIRVSERVNKDSPNCGVFGAPISLNIYPIPVAIAEPTLPVCVGQTLKLAASGGDSYLWSGPNGFISTDQNPIIPDAQKSMSGMYYVVVSANGCSSSSVATEAKVLDVVVAKTDEATIKICQGASTQLQATENKDYSYTWFPADGLSNPNIANPTASPDKTTTYTVTVTNGACSVTDTTRILVDKRQIIDAGKDLKIFSGQSKQLDAKIIGEGYTFYWTPVDFLDDPTKLDPIASPLKDITYTLHVISNSGCFEQTSSVFVKVYPEIIIPNAFSPNGDGVNDTWSIPAASAFDNAKIKIFNRYGNLVYKNEGMDISWDGKFKGIVLPAGVYYYMAYFNEDFKTYSGSITLLR